MIAGEPFSLVPPSTGSDTRVLSDADRAVATVFVCPEDITATHIGFHITTSQNPPTMIWAIESVDLATGLPTGTILGGGTAKNNSVFGGSTNVITWFALDTALAMTAGSYYALTVRYDSVVGDTIDATHDTTIRVGIDSFIGGFPGIPYWAFADDVGVWTKFHNSGGLWAVKDATKALGVTYDANSSVLEDFSSTVELAMRFKLDAGWGSTFKVVGCYFMGEWVADAKTIYFTLRDASLNIIHSKAMDGDLVVDKAARGGYRVYFDDATLTELTVGSVYYLTVCTDDSADGVQGIKCISSLELSGQPWGAEFHHATRSNSNRPPINGGTAFTLVDNWRPYLLPIIDEWAK